MPRKISEIKKELEDKLFKIAQKRKQAVSSFKKKTVDVRIQQIRKSLLDQYR